MLHVEEKLGLLVDCLIVYLYSFVCLFVLFSLVHFCMSCLCVSCLFVAITESMSDDECALCV